jgi:hypothetical protein
MYMFLPWRWKPSCGNCSSTPQDFIFLNVRGTGDVSTSFHKRGWHLLEEVIGRVEGQKRWGTFLEAGSRTAAEFLQAWGTMRLEARECSNYLGKELVGDLAPICRRAGGDKTDGSTRRAIVQQREGLRH